MTTTTVNTVVPLPKSDDPLFDKMRAELNKGVMVQWINADLMNRCGNDVRKSIVFYDDARTFETALTTAEWDALNESQRKFFLQRLYQATPIRYWSKGVRG